MLIKDALIQAVKNMRRRELEIRRLNIKKFFVHENNVGGVFVGTRELCEQYVRENILTARRMSRRETSAFAVSA